MVFCWDLQSRRKQHLDAGRCLGFERIAVRKVCEGQELPLLVAGRMPLGISDWQKLERSHCSFLTNPSLLLGNSSILAPKMFPDLT